MAGPRFLIVRIVALGDVAVTTGLLNRIRSDHPDAHVTWLCGERAEPLVRLFDGVHEVLTVSESRLLRGSLLARLGEIVTTWRKLGARKFDRVLLVHADRRYRVLFWPLVATPIAALAHGSNPLLGRYRGDEYARLLDPPDLPGPLIKRHPLADVRSKLPAVGDRATGTGARVVLVPGGARNILRVDQLRRWPAENYAELARRLVAAGVEVVLVGDANDVEALEHFRGIAVTSRIGELPLIQTLCVLRDADVVVSHDTGPLHFARLVRTPVIGLFGPTPPRNMVGEDPDVDVLWGGANLACRPCYDGRDYAQCSNNLCMKDTSVETVLRTVLARLDTEQRVV
jgi:lipopolysaccharide heptosyltransferase II